MVDLDLVAVFQRQQLGLITWRQARAAGLSEAMVLRRVESRTWYRIRRGVYAEPGVAPTYGQAVLAVILAAGVPGAASHRTAAALHGLKVPRPVAIDVVTLRGRTIRLDGVAHHRWLEMPAGDLVLWGGTVMCTTIARTLLDCISFLPGWQLSSAIDDVRRRRLMSMEAIEDVQRRLDRGPRTGRRKVVPLRPVVAARVDGKQEAGGSDLELAVLRVLRRAGRRLPVQQYPVTVAGQQRYLDFAYPAEQIAIEFDGFAEHGLIRSTFDDDRARDAELGLAGWLVLHFTSQTPRAELVDRVDRALAMRASIPEPA